MLLTNNTVLQEKYLEGAKMECVTIKKVFVVVANHP